MGVSTKMIRSFMVMKNNFVVVLRTTMTLEQAEMARIQGVNVRAMAGNVVLTRRARGRRAAWFFFQREKPTPHRRCRHAMIFFHDSNRDSRRRIGGAGYSSRLVR